MVMAGGSRQARSREGAGQGPCWALAGVIPATILLFSSVTIIFSSVHAKGWRRSETLRRLKESTIIIYRRSGSSSYDSSSSMV